MIIIISYLCMSCKHTILFAYMHILVVRQFSIRENKQGHYYGTHLKYILCVVVVTTVVVEWITIMAHVPYHTTYFFTWQQKRKLPVYCCCTVQTTRGRWRQWQYNHITRKEDKTLNKRHKLLVIKTSKQETWVYWKFKA